MSIAFRYPGASAAAAPMTTYQSGMTAGAPTATYAATPQAMVAAPTPTYASAAPAVVAAPQTAYATGAPISTFAAQTVAAAPAVYAAQTVAAAPAVYAAQTVAAAPAVYAAQTVAAAPAVYAAQTVASAPAVYAAPTTYSAPVVTASTYAAPATVFAAPVASSMYATTGAMQATQDAKQTTPMLDAAFDDENTFIRFVQNACQGKHTAEYKELYHFLLECFSEADSDFDGLVGHDRFDYMIERAAMLPRKFGLAPTEAETYPTPESRRAGREAEFRKINRSGSGQIAFDEWLEWCYEHICGKARALNSGAVSKCNWNEDSGHFRAWVIAACRSRHSREYKEMYHFLQECFTAADQDHDGRVNHAEFDKMIDVAADAPRRFGFAPPTAQTYPSDAQRIAGRQKEFREMDIHGHGFISFDDWLGWAYKHICGKARSLDPTLSGAPPVEGRAAAGGSAPCPYGFGISGVTASTTVRAAPTMMASPVMSQPRVVASPQYAVSGRY